MINVECQSCGKRIKASDKHAGKRVKCPNCSQAISIPSAPTEPPAPVEPVIPGPPTDIQQSAPVPEVEAPPVIDTATTATPPSQENTDFGFAAAADTGTTSVSSSYAKRRKRGSMMPMMVGCIVVVFGAVGAYWHFVMNAPQQLTLKKIDPQTVAENENFSHSIQLGNVDSPTPVTYALTDSPKTASINHKTGKITWQPTEADGPGKHSFAITATSTENAESKASISFTVTVTEVNQPPTLEEIAIQTAKIDVPVKFTAKASDADLPANELEFSLNNDAPETATIDPKTGEFQWTASRELRGETLNFKVIVKETGDNGLEAEQLVRIDIEKGPSPAAEFVAKLKAEGVEVELRQRDIDSQFAGRSAALVFKFGEAELFEYDSQQDAEEQAAEVSPDAKTMFGSPKEWDSDAHFYQTGELIAVYHGSSDVMLTIMNRHFGKTFAIAKGSTSTTPTTTVVAKDPDIDKLVSLYKEVRGRKKTKRLFLTTEYKAVRKVFADRFEREHKDEIEFSLGERNEAMQTFFENNIDLKEEFFTAVDSKHDEFRSALKILAELVEKYPKQIERYGQLAIAVALVWDKDRGVYQYGHHQRRCKASMPNDLIGAVENFQYFLDAEQVTQGRVLYMPWEFLTLLVNHKTPVPERQWALQNYLSKSVMYGKCYHDVPYDDVMLQTKSQTAALNNKIYNLPNIRQFGGVCAMQADFASRVGKSIGIPAAYVTGQSSFGEGHAWVMWIEVKGITPTSINFSLESHGRYRGDKFYVGSLRDPQTGQSITDCDLELRLQTVGLNPIAKRQAKMAMAAYPMIVQELGLGVSDRLKYLSDTISLCPGNEDAWIAVAKIAGAEDLIPKDRKQVSLAVTQMFKTFANVPDFTLKVFVDLIGFEDDEAEKIKFYEQLIGMYYNAGRPDLAFAARKQQIVLLVKNDRTLEAIQALAATIRRFPAEGKYIPGLLNQLEQLAANIDGADQQMVLFYKAFLPTIPQMRGNSPSKYCIQTFERGIKLFQAQGQAQLAQAFQVELEKIKAGMGRKK